MFIKPPWSELLPTISILSDSSFSPEMGVYWNDNPPLLISLILHPFVELWMKTRSVPGMGVYRLNCFRLSIILSPIVLPPSWSYKPDLTFFKKVSFMVKTYLSNNMPFRNIIRNSPNNLFHSGLLSCSHSFMVGQMAATRACPCESYHFDNRAAEWTIKN